MAVENTSGASPSFFAQASEIILNRSTTDAELLTFLNKAYSTTDISDGNLQAINMLMNMRSQRSTLISNIEDKRHNTAMSIISNTK